MQMQAIVFVCAILAVALSGCAGPTSRIGRIAPSAEVVTSAVVDTPVSVARAKVLERFSSRKWSVWTKEPYFIDNGFKTPTNSLGLSEVVPVYLEGVERSSFGWKFFRDQENRDKLFGSMHSPFLSHEYLVDGRPQSALRRSWSALLL